jgi:hypothetical protein
MSIILVSTCISACFESYIHGFYMFQAVSRSVFDYTGKPIVMAEFGYIGSGEAKSETERNAVLQKYGYANIDAVKADVAGFVQAFGDANYDLDENGNKCDSALVKEAKARLYDDDGNLVGEKETFDYLFNTDKSCHIYEELPKNFYLKGYPHTEQGQADFYKDIIPYLYDLDYIVGLFIYNYAESDSCYMCKQAECPVETAWGLVNEDYQPKLALEAVKNAYGNIKNDENRYAD